MEFRRAILARSLLHNGESVEFSRPNSEANWQQPSDSARSTQCDGGVRSGGIPLSLHGSPNHGILSRICSKTDRGQRPPTSFTLDLSISSIQSQTATHRFVSPETGCFDRCQGSMTCVCGMGSVNVDVTATTWTVSLLAISGDGVTTTAGRIFALRPAGSGNNAQTMSPCESCTERLSLERVLDFLVVPTLRRPMRTG